MGTLVNILNLLKDTKNDNKKLYGSKIWNSNKVDKYLERQLSKVDTKEVENVNNFLYI